jgi:hypothetical protein
MTGCLVKQRDNFTFTFTFTFTFYSYEYKKPIVHKHGLKQKRAQYNDLYETKRKPLIYKDYETFYETAEGDLIPFNFHWQHKPIS